MWPGLTTVTVPPCSAGRTAGPCLEAADHIGSPTVVAPLGGLASRCGHLAAIVSVCSSSGGTLSRCDHAL